MAIQGLDLDHGVPLFPCVPRAHPCWINIDQRQLHVKIEVIRVLFDGYQMETRWKNMFLSAYTSNTKSIVLQVASSAPRGLPRRAYIHLSTTPDRTRVV